MSLNPPSMSPSTPPSSPPPETGAPPLPTATAVALLLGGAVAVGVAGIGLWAIAEGSYPYAFGLDVRGDFPYPFPDAPAVWIGSLAVIVALTLGTSLVGAAGGRTRTPSGPGSASSSW